MENAYYNDSSHVRDFVKKHKIKAIFFCEFDDTEESRMQQSDGAVIKNQYPEDVIDKSTFDQVKLILIPKADFREKSITVKTEKYKILGHATGIKGDDYFRGIYLFNVCIVVENTEKSSPYIFPLQKICQFFKRIERDEKFLSQMNQDDDKRAAFQGYLRSIFSQLNNQGIINLTHDYNLLFTSISTFRKRPPNPENYEVPFIWPNNDIHQEIKDNCWDIAVQNVIDKIDNFNHISKITHLSGLPYTSVKTVIKDLIHYDAATLVSIFQWTNRYQPTSKIKDFLRNKILQNHFLSYVTKKTKPNLYEVITVLESISSDKTAKSIVKSVSGRSNFFENVNPKSFFQISQAYGLIYRVHEYPILEQKNDLVYGFNPNFARGINRNESSDSNPLNSSSRLTVRRGATPTGLVPQWSNSSNNFKTLSVSSHDGERLSDSDVFGFISQLVDGERHMDEIVTSLADKQHINLLTNCREMPKNISYKIVKQTLDDIFKDRSDVKLSYIYK